MGIYSRKAKRLLQLFAFFIFLHSIPVDSIGQKKGSKRPVVKRGSIATVTTRGDGLNSEESRRRAAAFYQVWAAIKQNYYDGKYSGLDWDAIRREYEPKALAAKTDAELHTLLSRMIGLLKRSHLEIIPPEVYETIAKTRLAIRRHERARNASTAEKPLTDKELELLDEEEEESGTGSERFGIGIDLKLIDNKFVISRLDPASTGEKAGLKLGQSIDRINGQSLQSMLEGVSIHYPVSKAAMIKNQLPSEIVENMIDSTHALPVELTVSDGAVAKELKVQRELIRNAETVILFPNFPPKLLQFESRSLNEKTGYIRFSHFGYAVIEKFCTAVGEHKAKETLIIDLRGNSGGLIAAMPILAGMLSAKPTEIGTMQYRYNEQKLVAKSLPKHFLGRIVVLVDGGTASAGEMFALLLKEHGRTIVVGQNTAGAALPSVIIKLTTGAVFQYPIANFKSGKGKYLEDVGLVPDQSVVLDRKSLLEGRDAQLEAALRISANPSAFPPTPEAVAVQTATAEPLPPPPAPKAVPKVVNPIGQALSGPVARSFPPGHDKVAKELVSNFINLIGGKDALNRLRSYSLEGETTISSGGMDLQFKVRLFRESADKYAEHAINASAGETRQFIVGKKMKIYSELAESQELDLPFRLNEADPLGVFFDLVDAEINFPSLGFTGEFDRLGRKTTVLEGKDRDGNTIALAFDVETKMLVSATGKIRNVGFGDYRKVSDLVLPFRLEQAGVETSVMSILINSPIDKANFEPRQNCYDKP